MPAGEVWRVVPGAAEEAGTWNMGLPNTGEVTNCGARAVGGGCRTSWGLTLLLLGAVTMVEATVEGVGVAGEGAGDEVEVTGLDVTKTVTWFRETTGEDTGTCGAVGAVNTGLGLALGMGLTPGELKLDAGLL